MGDVRRRRLLVLTSTFPRWEDDREPPFVFELAKRLSARFEVHVLAPHAPGAARAEEMEGVRIHRFRYAPEGWQRLAYEGGILSSLKASRWRLLLVPPFLLGLFFAVVRLGRRHRFDVVHAHWLIPQGVVALITRPFMRGRPPILVTSHGADLFGLRGRLMQRIKRFVLGNADGVTAVSEAMCAEAERICPGVGTQAISMGVDLRERFVPEGEVAKGVGRLLFVGRLVEKKGVGYLLRAVSRLHEADPEITLTVVGDGPERPALEALAVELGIDSRVEFRGAVGNDDLPPLFRAASIVVFPSVVAGGGDQEGFGLVLVEAMGCGVAVVASDLPGSRAILKDGITATVVPPADAERLVLALRRMLDSPEVRNALGRRGREHVVERFDWALVAEAYGAKLSGLAERGGAPVR